MRRAAGLPLRALNPAAPTLPRASECSTKRTRALRSPRTTLLPRPTTAFPSTACAVLVVGSNLDCQVSVFKFGSGEVRQTAYEEYAVATARPLLLREHGARTCVLRPGLECNFIPDPDVASFVASAAIRSLRITRSRDGDLRGQCAKSAMRKYACPSATVCARFARNCARGSCREGLHGFRTGRAGHARVAERAPRLH